MADSGLVDAAVMELLANDATLSALCPDGVYWNIRPPRVPPNPPASAFVIVALFDHIEQPGLGGITLWERTTYLVISRILAQSRTQARQAAARIQALLHGALPDLTAAGYTAMDFRRIDRVTLTEVDPINSATWHHFGGRYELMHYPTT